MGVARGSASRKVIALLGDGSAMYTIQGLWSAAEQNANVSFLILNNGRYAALEAFIRERHSYELPEIVQLPITAGSADYLRWVAEH